MLCPLEITGISDTYVLSLRYTLERCPSIQPGVFFLKVGRDLHFAALKAMQLGKFTSFLFVSLSYSAEFTGIFSLSGSVQYWQYPKQFDNFLAVP